MMRTLNVGVSKKVVKKMFKVSYIGLVMVVVLYSGKIFVRKRFSPILPPALENLSTHKIVTL